MIYLGFEVLMILSYMFNGYLGLIVSSIMFLLIWKDKVNTIENKTIISMILSVPVYNIGIMGIKMHHVLSWYNIFLTIYITILIIKKIKKEYKISKKTSALGLILIFLMCVNLCLEKNIYSSIVDFLQIFVMITSIILTYQARHVFIKKITDKDVENWMNKINITILAMAICTIIQFIIHKTTNNIWGIMTIFPKRVTYDLLFKGYSVLSLVLGMGIIINANNIFTKKGKLKNNIISIILCVIAIIVNSSRTGLVAALIVLIYIIFSNILKKQNIFNMNKKQLLKMLFFSILLIIIIIGIFSTMQLSRSKENIFGDNGRINTYINAIKIIFENPKNFLIGGGLNSNNYDFILPHNFILETTMKLGIIFMTVVIYLLIQLLKIIKNNSVKYIIWHIFIGSMLITSFHEMSFIILYIIIALISTTIYNCNVSLSKNQKKNKEKEKLLLTVIVPIYNGEKYLKRCVDSIINQTYKNIEVLLINDGSKDATIDICKEYAKNDKRVRVIDKENEGVSKARNIGIEEAKGEYITFIDADDWLELETYSKAIKTIENNNVDIYKFSYIRELGKIKRQYKYKVETDKKILKKDYEKEIYPYMFSTYDMSSVCLTIFKRNIIANIRFDTDLKYGEDFLFTTKAILKSKSIYIIPDVCYHYFCNNQSSTSKRGIESYITKIKDIVMANNKLLNEFKQKSKYVELKNKRIIKEYEQIIKQASGDSDYKEFIDNVQTIKEEVIYPLCPEIQKEKILGESYLYYIKIKLIEKIKKIIKDIQERII